MPFLPELPGWCCASCFDLYLHMICICAQLQTYPVTRQCFSVYVSFAELLMNWTELFYCWVTILDFRKVVTVRAMRACRVTRCKTTNSFNGGSRLCEWSASCHSCLVPGERVSSNHWLGIGGGVMLAGGAGAEPGWKAGENISCFFQELNPGSSSL